MRALLAATAVALGLAATAQAATPADLGPGTHPHVVVEANGEAQIAWSQSRSGDSDLARWCRIAEGLTQCVVQNDFTYPNDPNNGLDSGVWPLPTEDGRIYVLDGRCCRNYATKFLYMLSGTFDAGTEIGDDDNLGANINGGAIYTPANTVGRAQESILTFADSAMVGLSFQATGLTGPPPATTSNNILTGGDAINGSMALSGGTLMVAWLDIDDDVVYSRKWSGTGDVNDAATWDPATPIEVTSINAAPRLAYGQSGIFIAYNQGPSGGPIKTVVRHFNGTGWDPPTTLDDPGTTRFDLAEGPDGTLQFVYQDAEGGLSYRFSTTPGDSSFSPPQQLVPPGAPSYNNLKVAARQSAAWAVWEDGNVHALFFKPGQLPPPTRGSTVNVVPVKGRVFVRVPPSAAARSKNPWMRRAGAGFVPLESLGRQIPVGSRLDTKKGTVRLFSAADSSGKTQHGDFRGGQFDVGQPRKSPLTTLSMAGGGLKACGVRLPRGGAPKVHASRKHRRSLFSNVKGRFRTRGRNSTATVRGTQFTVTDSCGGTLTKVKKGSVKVRDLWKHKTVVVKAGHSYLARRGNR